MKTSRTSLNESFAVASSVYENREFGWRDRLRRLLRREDRSGSELIVGDDGTPSSSSRRAGRSVSGAVTDRSSGFPSRRPIRANGPRAGGATATKMQSRSSYPAIGGGDDRNGCRESGSGTRPVTSSGGFVAAASFRSAFEPLPTARRRIASRRASLEGERLARGSQALPSAGSRADGSLAEPPRPPRDRPD